MGIIQHMYIVALITEELIYRGSQFTFSVSDCSLLFSTCFSASVKLNRSTLSLKNKPQKPLAEKENF